MARVQLKSEGGGFFKWDKLGKSFTGEYVKLGEGVYQGRATYHAVFKQNGAEVKVNTPTVLRSILAENNPAPGTVLEITYTHDKKGNQPMPVKMFDVFDVGGGEGQQEEYARLLGLLRAGNPSGAASVEKALGAAYPDPVEREAQLRSVLKLQGVAA